MHSNGKDGKQNKEKRNCMFSSLFLSLISEKQKMFLSIFPHSKGTTPLSFNLSLFDINNHVFNLWFTISFFVKQNSLQWKGYETDLKRKRMSKKDTFLFPLFISKRRRKSCFSLFRLQIESQLQWKGARNRLWNERKSGRDRKKGQ